MMGIKDLYQETVQDNTSNPTNHFDNFETVCNKKISPKNKLCSKKLKTEDSFDQWFEEKWRELK
jgi:hypothetical protein